jgi:transposase-like protein
VITRLGIFLVNRATFRLASRKDRDAIKQDIKPIYTASNPDAELLALEELEEKWSKRYAGIIRAGLRQSRDCGV